jgi:hypothetical protein
MGQGVLQGSSSACPINIFNSDICLSAYKQCSTSASFIQPLTGKHISDHAVQFVDDTTQFINPLGSQPNQHASTPNMLDTPIFNLVQRNISEWNDIIWFSGGKLHPQKCYYFSFRLKYNFKKLTTSYDNFTPMARSS